MTEMFEHPMLQYIVGSPQIVAGMPAQKAMRPFDPQILDFFNALSKLLLKSGRAYSDVVTFAFWCRRSALESEKNKYDDIDKRLGKGVIFHSTPSNVPVNFAFSFAAGLLAGNANVVRIPGKPFAQVDMICDAINELLKADYAYMAPYIVFVKYPPQKEISDMFSGICHTRVVWGGDGTINELRQSPLPSRSNEITFADRHSIALIDADGYLAIEDKARVAQDFYNDTYFSDQNACTSPRVIVWTGKQKQKAKELFWKNVHGLVKEKYTMAPVQAIGKLNALYKTATQKKVRLVEAADNYITRIKVDDLTDIMKFKYNSGFFFEYDAKSIDELLPVCDLRCQTLTYCGVDADVIREFIFTKAPRGVDRAVPMGKSMDFTLVWDGHDLIREMSRRVGIL